MSNMNENLKAYLDGELNARDARQVEEALKRDASLRQEFDEMRRVSSTLREAAVAAPVVGLDKTLNALNKQSAIAKKPFFIRFAPALAVAAICIASVVIVGRFNELGGMDSRSSSAPFVDDTPMPMTKKPGVVTNNVASSPVEQKSRLGESGYDSDYAEGAVGGVPASKPAADGVRWTVGQDVTLSKSKTTFGVGSVAGTPTAAKDIVKTGEVHLKVEHGKDAIEAATKLAISLKGFVESSQLDGDDEKGMTGSLTLRIPVANFEKAMTELEKLGKVTGQSSNGQDVTSDVVDNESRLISLRAQEASYLKIMDGAHKIPDVMTVKEHLDQVQEEIASLTAAQKLLKNQAAMSTITLTIQQPAAKKKMVGMVKDDWVNKTWAGAWSTLAYAGRKITSALIYLIVFCPVWIPMVILANLVTRRLRHAA